MSVPTLLHLLEDQSSSDDVPCPKLERITIYAVGLNPEVYVRLGAEILAKKLVENPIKVVQRKPDNNFEVHLIEEENERPLLDIRWTRRW